MRNQTFISMIFGLAATASASRGPEQPPPRPAVINAITPQGCFAVDIDHLVQSSNSFVSTKKATFMSVGICGDMCKKKEKSVMLIHKNDCLCADIYPMKSALAADTACDVPCSGYPREACGGEGTASVFNVGLELHVDYMDEDSKKTGGQGEPEPSEEEKKMLANYKAAFQYASYLAQQSWDLGKEARVTTMGFICSLLDCGRDEADRDVEKGYESDDTIDELKGKKRE